MVAQDVFIEIILKIYEETIMFFIFVQFSRYREHNGMAAICAMPNNKFRPKNQIHDFGVNHDSVIMIFLWMIEMIETMMAIITQTKWPSQCMS